jgi:hypothetical protein
MRNIIGKLIIFVCLVNTASYADAYTLQDNTQEVGPVVSKSEAYLKVYSEVNSSVGDIDEVTRVPYKIYSPEGKLIKWVGFNDEDPRLITLPPGKYLIVPTTEKTKTVVVGANLVSGQLTKIHMMGE